jgi:hypothetical protein
MFSDFSFYRVGVISAHQKAISERCEGCEVDVVDRGDRGIRWPTLSLTGLKQRFGESRVDLMAYGRTPWS